METINEFFQMLSGFLWGWPMIILLLGTHLFLTFRLGIPQRKLLLGIRLSFKKDPDAKGDVSQFGALATALAATIGTGNIVGVATAVTLGGPGAVLWCWLTGIFGMSTKYAEGLLAVKYRVRSEDGRTYGGPMYALERGLNLRWLAILFAVFTALASFGIGCTVQANSIALLASETFGLPEWSVGLFVCILAASVILGGVKAIARVCTILVPFMAVFYVIGCLIILIMNSHYVWPAVQLIVQSAFNPSAAGGGFVGATVMMAARYGIARGLFSNESGMGSAPIVAAAAQTRNPVRQALVSSTGTFWDTVIICALTGLVLVSSILAYPDITYADGAALTKVAFSKIPYIGAPLLAFGILTFAFSTILGWSYYGESAVNYIEHRRSNRFYRIMYIVALFFGSIINLDIIWNIADTMNALMAIPNLVALLLLSKVAAQETKKYLWSGHIDDRMEE
jgi:AGCS family alanine or glycine:cation symporter